MQVKKDSKIVVLNNRGMGDCIISLNAIEYLKLLGEFSEIHFGVAARHASLFEHSVFSNVKVFGAEYRTIHGVIKLFKKLSEINPDYILELSPTRRVGKVIKCHKFLTLSEYEFFSAKNSSISWEGVLSSSSCLNTDLNDIFYVFDNSNNQPKVESFLPTTLSREELIYRPYIAMSMASSSQEHIPKVSDFLDLVAIVENKHPDKKIVFPISNTELDQKTKKDIIKIRGDIEFIEVSLESLPDFFMQCCFFVGMDTGIKHLAAFMGIPTFSYIPEKSYPHSHPYMNPHKAVLLNSDKQEVIFSFTKWMDDLEN